MPVVEQRKEVVPEKVQEPQKKEIKAPVTNRIQLKTPEPKKFSTISLSKKTSEYTPQREVQKSMIDSSPLGERTPLNQNEKRTREKEVEMKESKKIKQTPSLEERYESLILEFLTETKMDSELEKNLIEMRIDGEKKNESMTTMIEKMNEFQEELKKMTVDLLVENTKLLTLFDPDFDENVEEISKLYK